MILSKALFKRMVELFATTVAIPLWDDGEPWYMGVLTAPYTPGPDFEELAPGDFLEDASDAHYVSELPTTFLVGYVPGSEQLLVSATGNTAGDGQAVVSQPTTIGKTVYGYYLYYSDALDESWAATIPLETPVGPLAAGDLLQFPPIQFLFDPAFQV